MNSIENSNNLDIIPSDNFQLLPVTVALILGLAGFYGMEVGVRSIQHRWNIEAGNDLVDDIEASCGKQGTTSSPGCAKIPELRRRAQAGQIPSDLVLLIQASAMENVN